MSKTFGLGSRGSTTWPFPSHATPSSTSYGSSGGGPWQTTVVSSGKVLVYEFASPLGVLDRQPGVIVGEDIVWPDPQHLVTRRGYPEVSPSPRTTAWNSATSVPSWQAFSGGWRSFGRTTKRRSCRETQFGSASRSAMNVTNFDVLSTMTSPYSPTRRRCDPPRFPHRPPMVDDRFGPGNPEWNDRLRTRPSMANLTEPSNVPFYPRTVAVFRWFGALIEIHFN